MRAFHLFLKMRTLEVHTEATTNYFGNGDKTTLARLIAYILVPKEKL